jgi:hypothetical protein
MEFGVRTVPLSGEGGEGKELFCSLSDSQPVYPFLLFVCYIRGREKS